MTSNTPAPLRVESLLYALFIHSIKIKVRSKLFKKIWDFYWKKSLGVFSGPITTRLHGHQVILNYGYTYPIIIRQHNSYNAPLIELTHVMHEKKNNGLTIIDIGAAIGDTMLCLLANCPEMIGEFYCIDGDDEFFRYLKNNIKPFKNGKTIKSFLSSSEGEEQSLVKIHRGTASAQGLKKIPCTTLDQIIQKEQIKKVDIIKIDVDGFDGKVLAGSINMLSDYKPAVFFEWHPLLCEQVNNDWMEHFVTLSNCGYDRFIWFDNYGHFNHFTHDSDPQSIKILAHLLINNKLSPIAYYDIIALHKESTLSLSCLAELAHAKNRKSWI